MAVSCNCTSTGVRYYMHYAEGSMMPILLVSLLAASE